QTETKGIKSSISCRLLANSDQDATRIAGGLVHARGGLKMRTSPSVPDSGARPERLRRVALAFVVAALVGGPALAQSFLGAIRGTVTDPQGAAVPKAVVLIVDEQTGVSRSVDTDSDGRFEATTLRPGNYRVEVVTDQFKKYERPGVVLNASGVALVDVQL